MAVREIISVLIFVGVIFAVYAAEAYLIAGVVKSRRKGTGVPKQFLSWGAIIIHFLAIAGMCCFFYGYFIEPNRIEVSKIEIPTSKLHQAAIRLVQISDLHCTTRPENEKKLVKLVNGLEPDVVVFTGDAVNTRRALPLFKETLKNINASLGKYAVRGNFDYDWLPPMDYFGGTGFVELDANSIEVKKDGESIWITGVTCEKEGEIGSVLKKVPGDCFSIFMHHYPDLVEGLAGPNVDLYLAGHTHGGQVRLPFYGAIVTLSRFGKKYEAGMYTIGQTKLYVNRGIGLENNPLLRVRFLCRPEITVFDIKPPSAD